jgi:hypothetical protein
MPRMALEYTANGPMVHCVISLAISGVLFVSQKSALFVFGKPALSTVSLHSQ